MANTNIDALVFERVVIDGRPWNLWGDGTLLPVVRGGADEGDGDEGDEGGDAAAQAAAKAAEDAAAASDAEKWKALSRKNEAAAKKALADLEKMKAASQTEAEKAIETARSEAKAEVMSAANERIVKAEIKALAAGRLADPALAVRLLDHSQFQIGDDGEVDEKAITKAIGELVKQYPGLAGKGAAGNGSADGGARGAVGTQPDMNAWLRGERASL